MPLIIKELIAHIEHPQAEQRPLQAATGDQEESNQDLMEQLEINSERDERLSYD